MPVRINLKELFGSDSQNVTIDKLNFNFNKLLELGIGLKGDIGITGPEGAIGPTGIKGDVGERGNKWYVGSVNPNTLTFDDLEDGDFFADSTSSLFYNYNTSTKSWSVAIDLRTVVDTYLINAGTAFVRGLGADSPDDSRFIVFPNRGNSLADLLSDTYKSPAGSNNDVFFLSNFNEKFPSILDIDNFPSNLNEMYVSMQSIYVDYTNQILGRYHMDFGSLFKDDKEVYSIGGDKNILSDANNNLKIRHSVNGTSIIDSHGLPYLYKGILSISKYEYDSVDVIDSNTSLEIQTSKVDTIESIKDVLHFRFGGSFVHYEDLGVNDKIDGISIFSPSSNIYGISGILNNYSDVQNSPIIGKDLYTIKTNADGGILLNNGVYQDNGNIEQIGSTMRESTVVYDVERSAVGGFDKNLDPSVNTFGNVAIAVSGNNLFMIQGTCAVTGNILDEPFTDLVNESEYTGTYHKLSINNPNSPKTLQSSAYTGRTRTPLGQGLVSGTALSDIDVSGSLIVLTNAQYTGYIGLSYHEDSEHNLTYLQICEAFPDDPDDPINLISRIGHDTNGLPNIEDADNLSGAWRCEINGSRVVVATNRSHGWGLQSNASDTSMNSIGYISFVDISQPNEPKILPNSYSKNRSHFLDMAKMGKSIVTISADFGSPSGNYLTDYDIFLNYHDTDYSRIYNTSSTIIYSGNQLSRETFHDLSEYNPYAAVDTSGNYAFVVHRRYLIIYRLDYTLNTFVQHSSLTFELGTEDTRSLDCKVVGEDVYILASYGNVVNSHDPSSIKVYKVNVRNISNPKLINSIQLHESHTCATRFEVVGNNIYVASASGDNISGTPFNGLTLVDPIEVDGVKTSHANIGNIKTSSINITDSISIENHASIGDSLNVGYGGITSLGRIGTNYLDTNDIAVRSDLIFGTLGSTVLTNHLISGLSNAEIKIKSGTSTVIGEIGRKLILEAGETDDLNEKAGDLYILGGGGNSSNITPNFQSGYNGDGGDIYISGGVPEGLAGYSGAIHIGINPYNNIITRRINIGHNNVHSTDYKGEFDVRMSSVRYVASFINTATSGSSIDGPSGIYISVPMLNGSASNMILAESDSSLFKVNGKYGIFLNKLPEPSGPGTLLNLTTNSIQKFHIDESGNITKVGSIASSGTIECDRLSNIGIRETKNVPETASIDTIGSNAIAKIINNGGSSYNTLGQYLSALYINTPDITASSSGNTYLITASFRSDAVFYVKGDGKAYASSHQNTSDIRLKTDIRSISSSLSILNELNPVTYTHKLLNETKSGFIAQEIESFIPEAVSTEPSKEIPDLKFLDYNCIIPYNTAAIKELHEIVKEKDAKIAELEDRLSRLEKHLGL